MNHVRCIFIFRIFESELIRWIDKDFASEVELARFEYFDNKSFPRTNWKFWGNIKIIKLCSAEVESNFINKRNETRFPI